MGILKEIRSRAELAKKNNTYLEGLRQPLWERAFLLEGGQGRNINGNAFAMLKCIRRQQRFDDWKVFFAVMPDKVREAEERISFYGFIYGLFQNIHIYRFLHTHRDTH